MGQPRRIITIASGKGGVGKTTLAINFALALSHYGRTVLFDFDFETCSIRSFLDMNFPRDLYHFFSRDTPLSDCMAAIPEKLDPGRRYSNLRIVAAPRHFMEDFAHLKRAAQHKLIQAIQNLEADFVILDMKAGLDTEILDFMPYSNSGILIFTPRLPAAASAAAYLIKAQIFRKLQIFFSPHSPIVANISPSELSEILDLIHCADDVYQEDVPNLDAVFDVLHARYGKHPIVTALVQTLGTFQIHYVLNHFSGVEESYEQAVAPFARNIAEIVSTRLRIRNLGWIQQDPAIHEANCGRVPFLLGGISGVQKITDRKLREALEELEEMAAQVLRSRPLDLDRTKPGMDRYLSEQLSQLEATYGRVGKRSPVDNFHYIAAAAYHLIKTERPYHFGDIRILEPSQLQGMIMDSYSGT